MTTEPVIRFPVICPICLKETLAESPVGLVAEALMRDGALPLTSGCHGFTWSAGDVEREQIREYLAAGVPVDLGPRRHLFEF
jgi:hypothetical protein